MSQVDTNPDRTIEDAYRELVIDSYGDLGIERILRDNSATPFVRRILFPFNAPVITDTEDPKGRRVMTHKMEWSEADGGYYAYPRVMPDEPGNLRDYGSGAFDEAMRRRDFIKFDTPDMADNFTRLYKQYWNKIGYKPQVRQ